MFLDWKTLVEPKSMEHNRTSIKSFTFFVATVSELASKEDLVRWCTSWTRMLSLPSPIAHDFGACNTAAAHAGRAGRG